METIKQPSKKVPYYHYMCKCGKPVKTDHAWYDGKQQVHFDCLQVLLGKNFSDN